MADMIRSKERVKKHGEVFTPDKVVEDMLDLFPEEDIWAKLGATFLEPSCGNGQFLVGIYRRKLKLCKTPEDGLYALWTITGIDILPDNCEESRARLKAMFVERFPEATEADLLTCDRVLKNCIICGDSLRIQREWIEENKREEKEMQNKEYIPPIPRNHSVCCEICGRRIIPHEDEILGGQVKGQRRPSYFHRRCWQREQAESLPCDPAAELAYQKKMEKRGKKRCK